MSISVRALTVLKRLKKEYPRPKTALRYGNPFELLVATVLSAQTTDAQVNKVTEGLFRKYRKVSDYARASAEELAGEIGSVNYYKTKARNIQNSARMVVEKFSSIVPRTMDELTMLPGVARKTANIVLAGAYGIIEGIAVDTHVKRLSARLGLTKNTDPVKVEADLMELVSKKEWANFSFLLILLGRSVCSARAPAHPGCVLQDICPSNAI